MLFKFGITKECNSTEPMPKNHSNNKSISSSIKSCENITLECPFWIDYLLGIWNFSLYFDTMSKV